MKFLLALITRFQHLACFFIILIHFQTNAQVKNFKPEALLLKNALINNHFSPKLIDNAFSNGVFEHFLNVIDPDQLYFTEKDLQPLYRYKILLDDELNDGSFEFLPSITQAYRRCLERCETIIHRQTQNAFKFDISEIYHADSIAASSELQLEERWRLELKAEILSRLMEMKSKTNKISDGDFIKSNESVVRQWVKLSKLRKIRRVLDHPSGYESYLASLFFESIAATFDSHSAYLSVTSMENFMGALNAEGYYFGFTLKENEREDVIINQLTPGGPAWKSGEIHSGDIIKQIQWEGKEKIEIAGMDESEINEVLKQNNHSALYLTILNLAGEERIIKLKKEKLEAQENIVKSFILQGERKIGYISLPGFYSNWDQVETEGARCANDVATEIVKLKKEGVDGLILDVRFNGGGSLQEAVAMAGIFIDAGPIGILRTRQNELVTVKDMNRGTIYDGPLLVMVNGMSASASEFLAAALQDYHRAIIVGTRTFGKATAQHILPLDTKGTKSTNKPAFGFASVTINKIYRITGKTAQLRGVTPDIVLPDAMSRLKFREEDTDNPLPADSIQKKTYYQPNAMLPLKQLKEKSNARVMHSVVFNALEEYSKWLMSSLYKNEPMSLLWSNFKKQYDISEMEAKKVKMSMEVPRTATFTVSNHHFQQQHMRLDEYVDTFTKAQIQNLLQDVSLEEAYNIICDYTTLKN